MVPICHPERNILLPLLVVHDGEVMELAAGVGEPSVGGVRHALDEAQRVGVAVGQGQRVVLRSNREQLLVLSESGRNI